MPVGHFNSIAPNGTDFRANHGSTASLEVPFTDSCTNLYLSRFSACLAELLALQARPAPLRALPAGQRDRLCRLVRERIADQLAPDDLARAVGLSGDYFARLFRASFGVSPRQWLADERIRAAARLLHDCCTTAP